MIDPLILLALGSLVVIGSILVLRLHAFLALFLGALVVAALTPSESPIGERLAEGFGNTCAKIGILIALASIIGKAMLDSGAADRVVRSSLRRLGEPRAPLAFLGSGFFLGIPVFFDTVFYLMLPLGKAMGTRYPGNYLLYVLTIVAGASIAHSLVPPTPGPITVASMLNVDIGVMMMFGIIVGAFAALTGYAYAVWASHRWPIPLRETADISVAELEALAAKYDRELPPFWLAVLPILLPVVLIAGQAIAEGMFSSAHPEPQTANSASDNLQPAAAATDAPQVEVPSTTKQLMTELGNKNVALAIGAAIALGMLAHAKRSSAKEISVAMQSALSSAGVIILITAAGGMFGGILQQTGVGERIRELSTTYQIAVLPLAFVVTALVRIAQGSATVAMITAAGILGGFVEEPSTLGFHPVYLALAIGCGSKPFPWMNDSGFWVVCRMSGFTEAETLKTASVLISVMGCAGMIFVIVLVQIFPMPMG